MTWTRFAWMLGSVLAMACSSADDTGPAPAGDTGGSDTTTPTDSSKDDTASPPGDTTDTTPPPTDTTPPPPTCKPATITSTCGPNGVVRVVVKLGAGMPDAAGALVVKLHHLRLGSASTGGVYHTDKTVPATTVSASTGVDVEFDFCAGGAMWSEDNCEFNLFAYVDKNGNGALDAGEPAGRTVVSLSCKGSPPCFSLELGCTSGASCVAFTDPGACKCAATTCSSSFKTCT